MSETVLWPAALSRDNLRLGRLLAKLGPLIGLIGLIAVWALFATLKGYDFAKWDNQRLMLLQTAVVGTAVIGATVIGHVGRVAAVVLGGMTTLWCWGTFGAIGAIAAAVAAFGVILALNEFVLKRVPLAPFIVTLWMWGALRGTAKGLGDNQPVYPDEPTWLGDLMATAEGGLGAIMPPGVWILLILAVVMAGVLRYTRFGRYVFAIGSNEETARLCGIHVERVKLMIYVVGVGCAGLAGLLQFSYLSIGDPTTAEGYELKVIAAVVIGGASLAGGEGSILGTIVGALIMTVVDNGCNQLELDNWVQEIVTVAIIVAAVTLDRLGHRRIT